MPKIAYSHAAGPGGAWNTLGGVPDSRAVSIGEYLTYLRQVKVSVEAR